MSLTKTTLLFLAFMLIATVNNGQEQCATMPVYYNHLQTDNKHAYAQSEQLARAWLANPANFANALANKNSIIQIPVVVHVVYKNATQNIADSLIHSQIKVLNECFRKTNPNYVNTRPIFDSLGADIEIEFCLASKDPQGNPTTGIIRKQAPSNASFDPILNMDKVKKPAFGGDTAWSNASYLNIWTADMSIFGQAFVLGYATFPGSNPALDGVVIQWDYFGKYAKPNFLGKTTVHEIGHWLGMRHIWADDDNGQNPQSVYCDSTDFVNDTPNQGPKSNSNCNLSSNTCSVESAFWGNLNPPDMVENYMDYSKDACMTMFTKGQKARMYSFLNTDPNRIAIKTSTAGCNMITTDLNNKDFLSSQVKLMPQPASNMVKISLSAALNTANLRVYDNGGRLLLSAKNISKDYELRLENFANGIYFLQLNYINGISTSHKLVVVK